MDTFQIVLALAGLIGFLVPIFFIIAQKDREKAAVDPSIEEMKQRQRRKRENE
ncbi:hypothetical protein HSBGL_2998 [Halapricum desulfuricans]|uniref:Uncharacterized protein n=1 Tax=Halapricum desulfuricans TaxID=2841257 RepID=A0A897NM97_9EURY|nr:hypothetical protein [Halapricum desulfuricans]QSG13391.1 hypothetical protein HSBGL_2998 [Halapricum desulfuricans]